MAARKTSRGNKTRPSDAASKRNGAAKSRSTPARSDRSNGHSQSIGSYLIERLTAPTGILPGARVAVFGRDDERPMALRLLDTIPPARRIDLVGKLDLLTASACLARCAFYVGNDSGLMHLAAASGVPTLGLFGPTQESLYAPWGEHTAIVRTEIPFAEIFPPDFDHRTSDSLMDSLSVEAAEKGARELWNRARKDAA